MPVTPTSWSTWMATTPALLRATAAECTTQCDLNLVTVPLSSTGMVSIFNHAGNTNVVVDVDGYYTSTPSSDGSGLYNSLRSEPRHSAPEFYGHGVDLQSCR